MIIKKYYLFVSLFLSLFQIHSQNKNYSVKYEEKLKKIKLRCFGLFEENGEIKKGKSRIIYGEDTVDSDLEYDINGNKILDINLFDSGLIEKNRFDDNNNLIEKIITNPEKSFLHTEIFIFEKDIIKKEIFYSGSSKTKVTEIIFKYNEFGNNISKYCLDDRGNKLWEIKYSYDKKGNKTEEIYYEKDNSIYHLITYKYNTNNKLIQYTKSYPKNKIFTNQTYEYDSNNNRIILNDFDSSNSLIKTNKFYYNKKDILIKKEEFDSEKKMIRSVYLTYDKFDSIIQEKVTFYLNNEDIISSFDYTYDKNKNWISKTKYVNNKPRYVIERNIDYFN